MTLEEAVKNLNALGISYKVLETGTDGAALMLPEYGRILGLWPVWRGENAFWINPEFFRSLSIGAKQTEWVNPGGDRMWLYPEEEFFRVNAGLPDESYAVPHALDPGRFTGSVDKIGYVMENRGDLWASGAGARIGFRIVRRIRTYGEKELVKLWGTTYLRQAGYDEETSFEIEDSPVPVGVWNALYLAVGGSAHFPLDTPLGMKPIGVDCEVHDGCAVVPCLGNRSVRFSLEAPRIKARGAWFAVNAETGRSTLVLKEFGKAERRPGAELPAAEDGGTGIRCRGRHSPDCELHFHSPAAAPGRKRKAVWKHSVWAFSGRVEEVREFLRRVTA